MVKNDNPAGRLYEILSSALRHPNKATYLVWASVLNAPPDDMSEIFRRIWSLQVLCDEVKEKISTMEGLNTELYLSRFSKIEAAVKATNYDAPWDNYKSHLTEAAMLNLAHCAEALSRYDENPIEESELTELLQLIDTLSEKLHNGSVSVPLRIIILDMLESIRRSIAEYRIRGAEGMRKELAYCIGVLIQNHELFKEDDAKEEVGMLSRIMGKVNSLLTFALKLKELGFDFTKITGLIGQ